ncbi:hypothetical protein MPLSOD_50012 [Mesorhizobium sp. SOD10]|nr:hypothetical protein MPLSOD_50012 [Mesorhizobium sp. SOD10]
MNQAGQWSKPGILNRLKRPVLAEGTFSHGSHQNCRRQRAGRHHSDLGRQERGIAADDRLAAH